MILLVYSDNKASIPLAASIILILHRKCGKLHGAKVFLTIFISLLRWAQENLGILLVPVFFIRKEGIDIHCFLVSQISQMDYPKLKDPFRVQSIFNS